MISSIILFGISGGEILIILLVVLLLFGPSKIPEMARLIGRGVNEVKKVQREINTEIQRYSADVEKEARKIKQDIDELKKEVEKTVDNAVEPDSPAKRDYSYDQYGLDDEYSRSIGMPREMQPSAHNPGGETSIDDVSPEVSDSSPVEFVKENRGQSVSKSSSGGYMSENFESRTGADADAGSKTKAEGEAGTKVNPNAKAEAEAEAKAKAKAKVSVSTKRSQADKNSRQ